MLTRVTSGSDSSSDDVSDNDDSRLRSDADDVIVQFGPIEDDVDVDCVSMPTTDDTEMFLPSFSSAEFIIFYCLRLHR